MDSDGPVYLISRFATPLLLILSFFTRRLWCGVGATNERWRSPINLF
jgi:hypothetical protein